MRGESLDYAKRGGSYDGSLAAIGLAAVLRSDNAMAIETRGIDLDLLGALFSDALVGLRIGLDLVGLDYRFLQHGQIAVKLSLALSRFGRRTLVADLLGLWLDFLLLYIDGKVNLPRV